MGNNFSVDNYPDNPPILISKESLSKSKTKRLTQEEWEPLYEKECLKSSHSDYCFHFKSERIHDSYRLEICKHDSESGKPFMVDYPKDILVSYDFSEKKFQKASLNPPHTTIFPYRHQIVTNFLDISKTIKEIKEGCLGDCWGVYIRNVKTHQIMDQLYNFRIHTKIKKGRKPRDDVEISNILPDDWPEPRHPYFPSDSDEQEERDRFQDKFYVLKILQNLGEDQELVIVYNYKFMEEIYRPIPESENKNFFQITFRHNKEAYEFI